MHVQIPVEDHGVHQSMNSLCRMKAAHENSAQRPLFIKYEASGFRGKIYVGFTQPQLADNDSFLRDTVSNQHVFGPLTKGHQPIESEQELA